METIRLAGRRVLVMGLGRFGGGVSAVKFLVGQGADVTVTDTATQEKLTDSIKQLNGLPVTCHLGGHEESDFTGADLIVVNPAVRPDSTWLKLARNRGIPLTTEMNLFFERCRGMTVGVTGSNGKSTTAAMTAAVLEKAVEHQHRFDRVWLGGNIGQQRLLERVDQITEKSVVVLELSSFQLYWLGLVPRSPHVAVVTNLSPNHLDWHGDMAAYEQAKQNIVRYQQSDDIAILNRLDEAVGRWADSANGQVRWYPSVEPESIELAVPGRHNRVNAAAALEAAQALNIDRDDALDALKQYRSLEHRLEWVRELDGVNFYNDSIATTPESTIAAIESFAEKKVLILGGYDKKISFESLARRLAGQAEAVILIGQVRQTLQSLIESHKTRAGLNKPVCVLAESLEEAVQQAREHSSPGGVVLLSPACASYDMFVNFQQRGERFKEQVRTLP